MPTTLTPEIEEKEPIVSQPPGAARGLTIAFLAFIVALPLIQLGSDLMNRRPVQALDIFKELPTLENIQAYEDALERESKVMDATRPSMQWLLSRFSRRGNEKVIFGEGDWLFYRPSVDHVTKPGFMQAAEGIPADAPEGDPLSAILLFQESLKAHGVDLLLVPVPGKETIYPERLAAYDTSEGPPVNPDTTQFLKTLERRGVKVFDPTALLWDAKRRYKEPLYLPMDTHWSPTGMSVTAQALADWIRRGGYADAAPLAAYESVTQAVSNRGDIYEMLNLPKDRPLFRKTPVTVERVLTDGEPYVQPGDSPVLLLGDSFTNVFSDPTLNWGDSAGLGEHLALNLGVGVDFIALNDGGVNGSRARLARMPSLLNGKRLVIWQFAQRDLSAKAREWKRIRLRPPATSSKTAENRGLPTYTKERTP